MTVRTQNGHIFLLCFRKRWFLMGDKDISRNRMTNRKQSSNPTIDRTQQPVKLSDILRDNRKTNRTQSDNSMTEKKEQVDRTQNSKFDVVVDADKMEYCGDSEKTDRMKEIIEHYNSKSLSDEDLVEVLIILKKCGSCPILNYTNPISDRILCEKDCLLSFMGLILTAPASAGNHHNENLGYLLSSISDLSLNFLRECMDITGKKMELEKQKEIIEVKRNKRRADFYRRKLKYEELWVKADPKPTKAALAKELNISYQQLYRDFKELGYL